MSHILDIIKEIKQWQLDWEGWFADRRLPQPPDMETFARKLEDKYVVLERDSCPGDEKPNVQNIFVPGRYLGKTDLPD